MCTSRVCSHTLGSLASSQLLLELSNLAPRLSRHFPSAIDELILRSDSISSARRKPILPCCPPDQTNFAVYFLDKVRPKQVLLAAAWKLGCTRGCVAPIAQVCETQQPEVRYMFNPWLWSPTEIFGMAGRYKQMARALSGQEAKCLTLAKRDV